ISGGLLLSSAALTQIGARAKLPHGCWSGTHERGTSVLGLCFSELMTGAIDFIEAAANEQTEVEGPRPDQVWESGICAGRRRFRLRVGKGRGLLLIERFDIAVGVVAHRLQEGPPTATLQNSNSVEHHDDDRTQGTDSAWRKKLRRTPRDAQVEHSGRLQRRDRLPRSAQRSS